MFRPNSWKIKRFMIKMFTLITSGLSGITTYDIFNYKTDTCSYDILTHNTESTEMC